MNPDQYTDIDAAVYKVQKWQAQGEIVVFTNGCFDIIHKGHIQYLTEARSMGDRLIIGLNSDASVKLLNKGSARPLQDESGRAAVLEALSCVDHVELFEDETPAALIERLAPDVLVKGGDYKVEEVAGHEFVLANGGKVEILSFLPGYSTSAIEAKILKENGQD